jgi:two-component system chemotaxis response regulator CheB
VPTSDIVVVGGSAGSVSALAELTSALPADLPAAFAIVVHTSPESPRLLAEVLGRDSRMPVEYARDRAPLRRGRIVVAPPDRHLLFDDGHVRLDRGPHENHFRPAIDPLFRSAAKSFGGRVVGDHVVPIAKLADLLTRLTQGGRDNGEKRPMARSKVPRRPGRSATTTVQHEDSIYDGPPATYACPECGGALWEADEGALLRFRCRIGHGFNGESLLSAQDDGVEDALWTALRALEETAALRRRLSARMDGQGLEAIASGYAARAAEAERRCRASVPFSNGVSCAPPTSRPEVDPRSVAARRANG